MPHDRHEDLTWSCDWLKQTPHYHTRGRLRGGNMTWRGIFVSWTTKRGALETHGLWEKQPWAHNLEAIALKPEQTELNANFEVPRRSSSCLVEVCWYLQQKWSCFSQWPCAARVVTLCWIWWPGYNYLQIFIASAAKFHAVRVAST